MRPKTLTVPLTDSGCTISLIPLGKFVMKGFKVETGMGSSAVSFFAQDGSLTSAFFEVAKFSLPPKLFDEMGLSDGCGVRIAPMAWLKSRYFLATRFTSSTVTWRN